MYGNSRWLSDKCRQFMSHLSHHLMRCSNHLNPIVIYLHINMWYHSKLPNIDNRLQRGVLIHSMICPSCKCDLDSVIHLFLKCSTPNNLWQPLVFAGNSSPTCLCSCIDDLFKCGVDPSWSKFDSVKYEVVIQAFLWTIWGNKNDIYFTSSTKSIPILGSEVKYNYFLWFVVALIMMTCAEL